MPLVLNRLWSTASADVDRSARAQTKEETRIRLVHRPNNKMLGKTKSSKIEEEEEDYEHKYLISIDGKQ